MSLKELPLPSIASLRAIAALKSPHLALVRPARLGLGFESTGANQKTLADVEATLGGPGRLSLPYSLRWLLDVLTGLGVLHRALSFVHGEVQPENVVLGDDGIGRLIPVVRAHWARGEERSPEFLYYLAPEKLLGDRVDVRADVFSVGVMLWEALSGQRLIEAYTVDDIIARLMGGGIPRAHAPEGETWTAPLSSVAERAIAIDPGRRFANVAEMKTAIEAACQRYLASAPGMAELFGNPEARARSRVRDSIPPDSQRVTLPPDKTASEAPSSPNEAELDAAAERLSRSSFVPIDVDEELTTTRNVVPAPLSEPLPIVRRGKHVNTLLGVPPPVIENREPSAPDSVTLPFAKAAASTPPPVVIPTISPSASAPPPAPLPFGKTRIQFGVPDATRPEDRIRAAQLGPAPAAAIVAGYSPAHRAAPASPLAAPVAEQSFELMRPRKSRGALWLLIGAAAAMGLFAARPWLAQQVAAATGTDTTVPVQDEVAPQAAQSPVTPNTPAVDSSASSAPAIGIASTPPAPSATTNAGRPLGGPREQHVVIHDRLEPDVSPPAPAEPVAAPEPPKKEPAAEPPPTPSAPVVAPPAPKPKHVPVSDADRYGI